MNHGGREGQPMIKPKPRPRSKAASLRVTLWTLRRKAKDTARMAYLARMLRYLTAERLA